MARIQLILPLLFWAAWLNTPADGRTAWVDPWTGTTLYLGALVAIVAVVRLMARAAMRRTTAYQVGAVPNFHRTVTVARFSIIGLNAFALFALGYGNAVLAVAPTFHDRVEVLSAFASMLPTLIAWLGLIWTQYPIDRSVREQNAVFAVELGEPVHDVPTLGQYLLQGLRQQLLFTLVPIFAIWAARDVLFNLLHVVNRHEGSFADLGVWLGSSAVVYVFAPELLRRVLPTESMPASPLRDRLEAMCVRLNLRHRDILIWNTHYALANAAVMGVLRRVRYVLLSDLLLETMTADQTEAVFAHEAGHVKKHHLLWYAVFVLLFLFATNVAETLLNEWMYRHEITWPAWAQWAMPVGELGVFLLLFGALSRSFERQADAFAADALNRPGIGDIPARDGVAVFNSALRQVAHLNNMPLDAGAITRGRPLLSRVVGRTMYHAGTWLHGSIRSRMDHLQRLAQKPAADRFDLQMLAVRCLLLTGLCASAAWTVVQMVHGDQ